MAASYPSSAKSFTTKTDGSGQTIFAAHINDLQDEVVALESALVTNGVAHGLKPSVAGGQDLGTASLPWGTVRTRALNFDAVSSLTIATGIVTATRSHHSLDTEGAAGTDDLDTITATGLTDGFVLVLRPANIAHVVTLKDGTGNLLLNGDYALSSTDRTITLLYDGTNWRELARSATSGDVTRYAATVANLANTVSETSIVTISMPSGQMADGDVLEWNIALLYRYSSAGSPTAKWRMAWGSTNGTQQTTALATNGGTERQWLWRLTMHRVGADLWVYSEVSTLPLDTGIMVTNETQTNVTVVTAPDFTTTQTVALKYQMPDTANALSYVKPQSARVYRKG